MLAALSPWFWALPALFVLASILLTQPGEVWARLVATTGAHQKDLENRISIDETLPEGRGLVGNACRTQKSCISSDFLHDPRTLPWRELARAKKVAAGGAVPLVRDGRSVGVAIFYSDKTDAFDDETVVLLERLAENVCFALDNFDSEAKRRRADTERQQFRAAMDMALDAIFLTDRTIMRFIDVNETACRATGRSRQELLAMRARRCSAGALASNR